VIEKFVKDITQEEQEELCFIKGIGGDYYATLIKFFSRNAPIGKVLDYKKDRIVVLNKFGELQPFPMSLLDEVIEVFDSKFVEEIDEKYGELFKNDLPLFFMPKPNLVEIMKEAENVYQAALLYRANYEETLKEFYIKEQNV
jgi:hypothetical protein